MWSFGNIFVGACIILMIFCFIMGLRTVIRDAKGKKKQ